MALFSLILVTLVSTLTVKVGTVARMLTGLDRRKAAFQMRIYESLTEPSRRFAGRCRWQ